MAGVVVAIAMMAIGEDRVEAHPITRININNRKVERKIIEMEGEVSKLPKETCLVVVVLDL